MNILRETKYDDGSNWIATYQIGGFEYDVHYVNHESKVYPGTPLSSYERSRRVKGAVRSNCKKAKNLHQTRIDADADFLAKHAALYC